eukprot:5493825-Pyramimonas_sp.AAC.1
MNVYKWCSAVTRVISSAKMGLAMKPERQMTNSWQWQQYHLNSGARWRIYELPLPFNRTAPKSIISRIRE